MPSSISSYQEANSFSLLSSPLEDRTETVPTRLIPVNNRIASIMTVLENFPMIKTVELSAESWEIALSGSFETDCEGHKVIGLPYKTCENKLFHKIKTVLSWIIGTVITGISICTIVLSSLGKPFSFALFFLFTSLIVFITLHSSTALTIFQKTKNSHQQLNLLYKKLQQDNCSPHIFTFDLYAISTMMPLILKTTKKETCHKKISLSCLIIQIIALTILLLASLPLMLFQYGIASTGCTPLLGGLSIVSMVLISAASLFTLAGAGYVILKIVSSIHFLQQEDPGHQFVAAIDYLCNSRKEIARLAE